MAEEGDISLAAPAHSNRKGPPSDGNNTLPDSPSPDGQKELKTSKSRCKRCAESHLRCSILQTGYPCDYCRRNKIQCTPSVMLRKGIKLGTKRGPYKKTKSSGTESTRPETGEYQRIYLPFFKSNWKVANIYQPPIPQKSRQQALSSKETKVSQICRNGREIW